MALPSLLLALIPLLTPTSAACESECEPVESQLSNCGLPPISPVWQEGSRQHRNISGWPKGEWWQPVGNSDIGPLTWFVANISQAECLCPEGREEIVTCMTCYSKVLIDDDEDGEKYYEADRVRQDCRAFGYYRDDTLAYPSTTRSSMPSATAPPLGNFINPGCDDICGVMDSQALECNLMALPAKEKPDKVYLPNPDAMSRLGRYLLNRTAAECMCTLPVLRRHVACKDCLRRGGYPREEPAPRERVSDYGDECHEMGYWSDDQFTIPKAWLNPNNDDDDDDSSDAGTTDSDRTFDGSSPSATDHETDGVRPLSISMCLVTFSVVVTGLVFVL